MSTVENGVIRQLSVSQAERFDPKQKAGCPRAWWFEQVDGRKPEQDDAQKEGDIGHAHLAHYFLTGQPPEGRVKLGKHVRAAITKQYPDGGARLPAPGPDLEVERRFSGQPKYDNETCNCGHARAKHDPAEDHGACLECTCLDFKPRWVPLDRERTFWLGGIPWEGFIDLRYRRSEIVDVVDHKFSSDINAPWNLRGPDLIRTIQMPVYALDALRKWPDAAQFRLTHHYVSRRGVESDLRPVLVTRDQILERKADIENVVSEMKVIATVKSQDDVPFNRKACDAYMGCPHQSICKAFKEKRKVEMTPDEAALFDGLDDLAPVATAPAVDPFADMEPAAPQAAPVPAPVAPAPAKKSLIQDESTTPDEVLKAARDAGKEIRCSRCAHSFGPRPAGHQVAMTLCPNVNKHGADCPDCGHPMSLTSDGPFCPQLATHRPQVIPPDAPKNEATPPAHAKRGRPPKVKTPAPETTAAASAVVQATPEVAPQVIDAVTKTATVPATVVPPTVRQVVEHVVTFRVDPESIAALAKFLGR